MSKLSAEHKRQLRRWAQDPLAFVRECLEVEPDTWQVEALRSVAPRVAMKACKGPGKSSVLAWRALHLAGFHPHSNGIAVSITSDNLRDNLWKEIGVWYSRPKMAWFRAAFELTAERLFAREAPRTWWLAARSFAQDARPDQQANTLAGLHAKVVYVLLDEVSDMPAGVVQAARGIFTVRDTQAYLIVAGNPTRAEGPLYDICTRERDSWDLIEITGDPDDPKRSNRIDIDNARAEIARWGRDHPVVQTNILGVFPTRAIDKLLSPDDIMRAEKRDAPVSVWSKEPIVWGLDCARYGTDFSVLQKRQGPIAWRAHKFAHCDGPTLANLVSGVIQRDTEGKDAWGARKRRPDYLFVDVTGIGASPFDHLKLLGWSDIAVPVDFGASPEDQYYADKRAEMYDRAAKWVRTEGCLPSGSNRLGSQLCEPHIKWGERGRRSCLILEKKEDMRKRGVASPDDADALALTFASSTLVRRDWSHGRQPDGTPLEYSHEAGKCVTEYERSA